MRHDLLIEKLASYGFPLNTLRYINSHLTNRNQDVRINNIYNNLQKAILEVR